MANATVRIEVGIRELRDQLSRYLGRVRDAGEEIVVTDHGHPVAYIVPHPRSDRLAELIAQGRAKAPRRRTRTLPDPVPYEGTIDDLAGAVRAQRR
ncbi:MAG: type II toxin-antitoxin system prevent-host-death family antitoxin [Candidatus Dormibacteraeota bacterium]|nr:type II toxin-antitoxin system prevent-host-death family antitoxin [Candidatus Dormibacteraeota bacterium]